MKSFVRTARRKAATWKTGVHGRIILKWFVKKYGEGINLIHFAQYACRTKGGIVVGAVIRMKSNKP